MERLRRRIETPRGHRRAHRRARRRPAPAPARAAARARVAGLEPGAHDRPAGGLPRAAHQRAVPAEDKRRDRGHEPRSRRRASRPSSPTSAPRSRRSAIDCVIVDADLRRPTQHKIFGVDNYDRPLDAALGPQPADRSQAVRLPEPVGDPERPAAAGPDGDAARALRPLVERLRDLDALILIDTPPVLPVSDARLIAPHCDGVLVVVARRRGQAGGARDRARAPLVRARQPARHRAQPVRRTTSRRPAATTTRAARGRGACSSAWAAAAASARGEWPLIVLIAVGRRGPDRVRAGARDRRARRC